MYASTDVQIKREQWDYLVQERPKWSDMWFLGKGDFNDIRDNEEKSGGRRRPESNFRNFRRFIQDINRNEGG